MTFFTNDDTHFKSLSKPKWALKVNAHLYNVDLLNLSMDEWMVLFAMKANIVGLLLVEIQI